MDFVGARKLNLEHRRLTIEIRHLKKRELELFSDEKSAEKAGNWNRANDLKQQRQVVSTQRKQAEAAANTLERQAIEATW